MYCKKRTLTDQSCPDDGKFSYASIRRMFLAQETTKLEAAQNLSQGDWSKDVHHYEHAKFVYQIMVRYGNWPHLKDWMERVVGFTDKDFKKDVVIHQAELFQHARETFREVLGIRVPADHQRRTLQVHDGSHDR